MKQLWRILPDKELKLENQLIRLIEANKKQLYRIARLYTTTDQQALEIVHHAVFRAYMSKRQLKKNKNQKCWLIQKVLESAELLVQQQIEDGAESNENELRVSGKNEIGMELEAALRKLPDKQRAIIYLRYFEDMKPEEIGEILGFSSEMVKITLYKALTKLELELEEVRAYE